jgi:uncharacterized protein (TIGR03067 family)
MRLLILLLAAVLALGCSREGTSGHRGNGNVRGEERPRGAQPEQTGLDGTWKVVSASFDGKPRPADRFRDIRVTISGRQYATTKGGQVVERATMTADPSKQPKTIDLAFAEGESKGQTLLGIYELSGDTLRIVMTEPGKARPADFINRAGLRQEIWELRRE